MDDERLVQETIARCVAIMVHYYNCGPKEHATREMKAETQALAAQVRKHLPRLDDVVRRIFRPVEDELYARYGHELGSRMNAHFLSAFEGDGTFCGKAADRSIETPVSRPRPS